MFVTPHHQAFKLSAPIDTVPAGATGQLRRLDSYHVALIFNDNHEDLVFDVEDTDPELWATIQPLHTRRGLMWRRVVMVATVVVATLAVDILVDCYGPTVAHAAEAIPEIIIEYLSYM